MDRNLSRPEPHRRDSDDAPPSHPHANANANAAVNRRGDMSALPVDVCDDDDADDDGDAAPYVPSQMLPPPVPSAASKRRVPQGGEESPPKRTSLSSTGSSNDFGARAQADIVKFYTNRCWHCRATPVHKAHVFARADENLEDCQGLGLVGFRGLGDTGNCIPLCPTCHAAFDALHRPRLVVVPAHLDFFFDAEYRWQDQNRGSSPSIRTPPTAEEYWRHCHACADKHPELDVQEKGGVYIAYMDQHFLSPELARGPRVRTWHGDPMAMVYKAIQAAHQITLPRGLPVPIRDQLARLHALYDRGNERVRAGFARGPPVSGSEPHCPPHDQPGPSGSDNASPHNRGPPSHSPADRSPSQWPYPSGHSHRNNASRSPHRDHDALPSPPATDPENSRKRGRDDDGGDPASSDECKEPCSKRHRLYKNSSPMQQSLPSALERAMAKHRMELQRKQEPAEREHEYEYEDRLGQSFYRLDDNSSTSFKQEMEMSPDADAFERAMAQRRAELRQMQTEGEYGPDRSSHQLVDECVRFGGLAAEEDEGDDVGVVGAEDDGYLED